MDSAKEEVICGIQPRRQCHPALQMSSRQQHQNLSETVELSYVATFGREVIVQPARSLMACEFGVFCVGWYCDTSASLYYIIRGALINLNVCYTSLFMPSTFHPAA